MALSLNNRGELIKAVVDYLDRPDLEPQCPAWVALAESRFNGSLRAREMENRQDIAKDAAEGALPDDFLEWIAIEWAGQGRIARPTYAETDSPEARYRHRPGGDPQYFTLSVRSVRLVPARPGAITLVYYQKVPALTVDDTANWLLRRAPEAYLYATIAEAYLYEKAPDQAQAHLQMTLQALGSVGLAADTQKLSRRQGREAEVAASAQAAARPD